ncbi:MAG: IS66 family transposase [bacterium]
MPQETDAEKIARLEREIERLKQENERLRRALEEALRAGKRQAAPFGRRTLKAHPEKPGRKPGACYGRASRRPVPEQVDETLEAPLPPQCPHCQGAVAETGVLDQYQTEIPQPRVHHIRFRVHVGRCQRCGWRVQGRHPRQTSDALGSAASQLGPRAVALATQLDKGLGLSHGKTAAVLEAAFGLRVSRSGLCQAFYRVAHKAEPTYQQLIEVIRNSPSVTPDETGWKVGGRLWWLWTFASAQVTVYSIQPGRGFDQASGVLGVGFTGFLVHDGWSPYLQFQQALHQTCLAHLLRRCREMIEIASPTATRFPQAVQDILQQALQLRDRREAGRISPHGLAVARGRLEARLDRALQRHYRCPANERLANHLWRNRDLVFTFLYYPGLEATNWRAEQALRPAVVTRKVWGGNRTPQGAHTQEVLTSVLQTCRQQKRSWAALLIEMLCSSFCQAWNLAASDLSPPQAR